VSILHRVTIRPGAAQPEYNRDQLEMVSFLTELKRTNMFKVAVVYVNVGWLLAQVAEFVEVFDRLINAE
jgi:hypothetical protein